MNIIKTLTNINLCYVILLVLAAIVLNIHLKRNISKQNRQICIIFYLAISLLSFTYINGVIQSIFQLKYLDAKTYLMVILIANIIILYTINRPMKVGYKILNYTLFIFLMVIFGSTVMVILGNKIDTFYVMDISNAVNFIDLSLVLFILYLIIICIMNIGYYLFDTKEKTEVEGKLNTIFQKKHIMKEAKQEKNLLREKKGLPFRKKQKPSIQDKQTLSREALLSYQRGEKFYIDGVECSIIFEDSNQENIVKNYQILSEDIHARMVNGYTLEENRMLKNICMKLQVSNLGSIDIHNVSLLNRISVEEYDLLRRVFRV